MRTTLTLDDDVAARINRLRETRSIGLKDAINQALRAGLVSLENPAKAKFSAPITVFDCGACVLDITSTSEALGLIEETAFE